MLQVPGVKEMAGLAVGKMTIGKEVVPAVGIDPVRGKVEPTLDAGRLPCRGDEIALGAKTMRNTHTRLGDVITARIDDRPVRLHVVGVATIPAFGNAAFSQAGLGTGAVGRASLFPQQDPEAPGKYNYLLLGYGDSPATSAQLKALDRAMRKFGCTDPVCVLTDLRPDEINGFRGAQERAARGRHRRRAVALRDADAHGAEHDAQTAGRSRGTARARLYSASARVDRCGGRHSC